MGEIPKTEKQTPETRLLGNLNKETTLKTIKNKKKSVKEYDELSDSLTVRVRVNEVEWYTLKDAREFVLQHFAKTERLPLIDRDAFCFSVSIEKTKDGTYLSRSYWKYFNSIT